MLQSDLCDFSDAYIVVKETITVTGTNTKSRKSKSLTFENNTPLIVCISKINNMHIDNEEDLAAAMPMYNLIEYSKNYRETMGSLWNYYRDDTNDM